MCLAIRDTEENLAFGDTFHNDRHPGHQTADVLMNRPFKEIDQGDKRLGDSRYVQYEELSHWRACQHP